MKKNVLYLASFLQPENFGPGRIISITFSDRPKKLDVAGVFEPFAPSAKLTNEYYLQKEAGMSPGEAGANFSKGYKEQLQKVIAEIELTAKNLNKSPIEILPFQDGDTLASWERKEYTHYRKTLVPYLESLGYEVVAN